MAKKRNDFKEIAKSLGIAIPVSLLFAGNANATPVNTIVNESMQIVEKSMRLQGENEVISRIVWVLDANKKSLDLAAHTDTHSNVSGSHTDNHSNRAHADTHTNRNNGANVCPSHTDKHSNVSGTDSHTNSRTPHADRHTNRKDNC